MLNTLPDALDACGKLFARAGRTLAGRRREVDNAKIGDLQHAARPLS